MLDTIEMRELTFSNGYKHNDQPFTGIAIDYFDNGRVMSEIMLVDGVEEGLQREYYEAGEIRSRTMMKHNMIHGHYYNWYQDGQLKIESLLEYGIIIWQKHYASDGNLEYNYHISSDEDNYKRLLKYRDEKGWTIECI